MGVHIGTLLDNTLAGDPASVNTMFGDALDTIATGAIGGNDILTAGAHGTNLVFGDVGGDLNSSKGGNDILTAGADASNEMFGDASGLVMVVIAEGFNADGGNDLLIGGDRATNTLAGDGRFLGRFSRGGNDVLIGGNDSTNELFGDAKDDFNDVDVGGNDQLTGGANSINRMAGDAGGNFIASINPSGGHGGNDQLVGGANSTNTMFGDAAGEMFLAKGGADLLAAGASGDNTLVGDADILRRSVGGDDLLISGTGTDDMWGDARQVLEGSIGGKDVFRFADDNGNDIIHDFERGKDLIDANGVTAVGSLQTALARGRLAASVQSAVATLDIEETDANGDGTTDSVIHFDADNSVAVLGITGLTEADFVPPGTSYVLFGHTSLPAGIRDTWVGSEKNSEPGTTNLHLGVAKSSFNADTAIAAGTVLAGPGEADYAADGMLINANVAMFDLTESPRGVFATDAPTELDVKITSGAALFGAANTDLDPANSDIDPASSKLHLAQTDQDWNGIKNLEISLDSHTSFRDIQLENFVDMRLKIGDVPPDPGGAQGEHFDVRLFGAKRGEVDASFAPQAIDLQLTIWTNDGGFANTFDIKSSAFGDTVTVRPGQVIDSRFGQSESWYAGEGLYLGVFTSLFVNLAGGDDIFDSVFAMGPPSDGEPLQTRDNVWGRSGDDVIATGNGADHLFGENGTDVWANFTHDVGVEVAGDDTLDAGVGADYLEGGGDRGSFEVLSSGELRRTGGDHLSLGFGPQGVGFDGQADTVFFNDGDGRDTVAAFDVTMDLLRINSFGEPITRSVIVDEIAGAGTLIRPGTDGDALFLIGVIDHAAIHIF